MRRRHSIVYMYPVPGPVRLKTPGGRVVRICIPVLLEGGVGFYCLGRLASIVASSTLASLKSAIGKWLLLRYIEKLRRGVGEGRIKPGLILSCGNVENVDIVEHRLLGLRVLELKVSHTKGTYVISQADTPSEFREPVLSIKTHLEKECLDMNHQVVES